MEEVKHDKCGKCKCWRLPSEFLNPKGRLLKSCSDCRERGRISRAKNKCEHKRVKSKCKDCGGSAICEHQRQKSQCKDCGGASICEHNRRKSRCKDCGGASICEHNRQKPTCKDCGGSAICEHNMRKTTCKECDPDGHLKGIVGGAVSRVISKGGQREKSTVEYLGCDISTYRDYLEAKFRDGMTWENYGELWQIDHIVPLTYGNPTVEEAFERLNFTNTQPLTVKENLAKGNRSIW